MKEFIQYWIAVARLTKAQAFALFYRFVRMISHSYDVEWGEYDSDEEDRPWVALEDAPEPTWEEKCIKGDDGV